METTKWVLRQRRKGKDLPKEEIKEEKQVCEVKEKQSKIGIGRGYKCERGCRTSQLSTHKTLIWQRDGRNNPKVLVRIETTTSHMIHSRVSSISKGVACIYIQI